MGELHVSHVANRGHHAHYLLFVAVLDRARLHHCRHAVLPIYRLLLEFSQHVDVDKVGAERHVGDASLAHLFFDRARELSDLLARRGTGGTFHPGI